MGWQGTPHVSTNQFELIASGLPAGSPGRFVYGSTTMQQPFGNGFRCVAGPTYSLPVVQADVFGDAHQILDPAVLPAPISPGQQWHFQYWYRNPLAGGAGFNASDGLSVTFCP
jgi:hypothetical protein